MAQVSNFYQESEVTVGTAKYKLSAPLNTIYNVDDELDLSIAQSAWNKQQYFGISPRNSSTEAYNKRIPVTGVTSFTPTVQYKSSAAPASANFYNVAYNPKVGTEQISMYPCIVSGTSNCFIGTQYLPDVDPYKTTSELKVFTDFKYGEILFVTPSIQGWKKSEFSFDNMYSSGNILSATSIPWEDFIANPSDYYIVNDIMPLSAYIWNGSKYVSSGTSTINAVRPAYVINSKWLKSFQVREFLPNGCEFYVDNFKAGDLPAVPQIFVNQYRDGLTTKMPWGLTTNNSVAGSLFNYSFIDYTGVETNWNFEAMPNPRDIETGTYEGEYFSSEEFEGIGYKARARNVGKATRTSDTRYGYVSFRTYFDIVYDGQLAHDLIAGLGMYFINTNDSTKFNTYNPDTIQNCEYAYLGEMDASGYTTCRFIHGEELEKYEGWNGKGGYVNGGFDPGKKPVGPDDDPWGDITWGGIYGGAGAFTNLWYCTSSQLANLARWMSGRDVQNPLPEGFDPMRQVIGLMQFPIPLGGTAQEELIMRTQANMTVHSGVFMNKGQGDDLYYNLGSVDIPLRMKERGIPFLDYESTVEIYVPFCGVFQLDTQTVLGRSVSVDFWVSPVTGECNCIVYVMNGGMRGPVAFGSGNMAAAIPVSETGYGTYLAAAKEGSLKRNELMLGAVSGGLSNVLAAGNTANTLAIGEQIVGESIAGAFGAVGAALGGIGAVGGIAVNLAQASQNIHALDVGMQHLKNASGTSVSGSFSGTSAWHYPMHAYVKITRPHYKKPDNYAHTQGIPLVESRALSSCHGFTMCVGTDLSGINATETEKEIIAAFLNNGVIV